MTGSRQLRLYLFHRADGLDRDEAARMAGFSAAEAKLTEAARDRGELADIEPLNPAAGDAASEGEADMAKKTKPGDKVTNLSESKDIIRNNVPKIVNLKKRRKDLNAEIAALREEVNAVGVPKQALDYAIRVREMDPDVRAAFDEGYAIARDAIGLKMSGSLFDFIETPAAPANETGDVTEDAAA